MIFYVFPLVFFFPLGMWTTLSPWIYSEATLFLSNQCRTIIEMAVLKNYLSFPLFLTRYHCTLITLWANSNVELSHIYGWKNTEVRIKLHIYSSWLKWIGRGQPNPPPMRWIFLKKHVKLENWLNLDGSKWI